jgi:hypothetical protein
MAFVTFGFVESFQDFKGFHNVYNFFPLDLELLTLKIFPSPFRAKWAQKNGMAPKNPSNVKNCQRKGSGLEKCQ